MIRIQFMSSVVFGLASVAAETALAQSATPSPSVSANVEGRPRTDRRKSEGPHYYLWHDSDGWHLHSRTGGKGHIFAGTVKVAGGKIYELKGIGGLEKKKDFGSLNRAENAVTFRFQTFEYGDGLDFKVSGDATRLDFELKVDGYGRPKLIEIGPEGESPPSHIFSVPISTPSK